MFSIFFITWKLTNLYAKKRIWGSTTVIMIWRDQTHNDNLWQLWTLTTCKFYICMLLFWAASGFKGGYKWGPARARAPWIGEKINKMLQLLEKIVEKMRDSKLCPTSPGYSIIYSSFYSLFACIWQVMPHLIKIISYMCYIYFFFYTVNNKIHTID